MDRQIIDRREKNEFTDCQKCGVDLRNGPVPRDQKKFYGAHAHYSALIGLKMDAQVDIVTHWKCPKCEFVFPRFQ